MEYNGFYHVQKILALDMFLSLLNLVHTFSSYAFKIHLFSFYTSTSWSQMWYINFTQFQVYQIETLYWNSSFLPLVLHDSPITYPFIVSSVIIFGKWKKLLSWP